jgi:hypothetical protein
MVKLKLHNSGAAHSMKYITIAKFIVPDWRIKSTMAWGGRTGPPAYWPDGPVRKPYAIGSLVNSSQRLCMNWASVLS